jgi:hypothetical protein
MKGKYSRILFSVAGFAIFLLFAFGSGEVTDTTEEDFTINESAAEKAERLAAENKKPAAQKKFATLREQLHKKYAAAWKIAEGSYDPADKEKIENGIRDFFNSYSGEEGNTGGKVLTDWVGRVTKVSVDMDDSHVLGIQANDAGIITAFGGITISPSDKLNGQMSGAVLSKLQEGDWVRFSGQFSWGGGACLHMGTTDRDEKYWRMLDLLKSLRSVTCVFDFSKVEKLNQ